MRSPYVEVLGPLRGGSGGAVGAGGFVVGDGAAGGDRGCRRTGRGTGGRAGARASQGGGGRSNCDPPATAGTRVVPVCRQDGGSPYGYVPHRNRMHGGVVLFASLKGVW